MNKKLPSLNKLRKGRRQEKHCALYLLEEKKKSQSEPTDR